MMVLGPGLRGLRHALGRAQERVAARGHQRADGRHGSGRARRGRAGARAEPTGAVVEPHAGEQVLAASAAFSPASFERIAADRQPSYMVASLGPLMVEPGHRSHAGPGARRRSGGAFRRHPRGVRPVGAVQREDVHVQLQHRQVRAEAGRQGLQRRDARPAAADDRQRLRQPAGGPTGRQQPAAVAALGAAAEVGPLPDQQHARHRRSLRHRQQEFGLQKTRADFGQTIGIWGIGPGPFLVLPLMPPLTVRDGIGTAVDGAMDPLSYVLPSAGRVSR